MIYFIKLKYTSIFTCIARFNFQFPKMTVKHRPHRSTYVFHVSCNVHIVQHNWSTCASQLGTFGGNMAEIAQYFLTKIIHFVVIAYLTRLELLDIMNLLRSIYIVFVVSVQKIVFHFQFLWKSARAKNCYNKLFI